MGIEELMDNGGKELLQDCLNNVPLYTTVVKVCGYQRITIEAMKDGEGIVAYTSFNGPDGKIYDVQKGIRNPNIHGRAPESLLLDFFGKMDTMKHNAAYWVMIHCTKFSLPEGELRKIIGHTMKHAYKSVGRLWV